MRLRKARRRRGMILVVVLVCLAIAGMLMASLSRLAVARHDVSRAAQWQLQATWLAESGMQRALAQLAADPQYKGETWEPSADEGGVFDESGAMVVIEVENVPEGPGQRTIRVLADYPNHPQHRCRQIKEAVVPLRL